MPAEGGVRRGELRYGCGRGWGERWGGSMGNLCILVEVRGKLRCVGCAVLLCHHTDGEMESCGLVESWLCPVGLVMMGLNPTGLRGAERERS